MRFKIGVRGQFAQRLQDRIEKWAATNKVSARLRIPKELEWVYWQEYGVPGHTILPVESKMLAFPGEGGTELRDQVEWPGVKPHHTILNAMDEIADAAREHLVQAMNRGGADDPEIVKEEMAQAVETAKALIVSGYERDLPGTRPDNAEYPKQSGKLHGETAASVFDELAEVVDGSE